MNSLAFAVKNALRCIGNHYLFEAKIVIDKTTLTVALLQLSPIALNLTASFEKGERFCRLARTLGADVVLVTVKALIVKSRIYSGEKQC